MVFSGGYLFRTGEADDANRSASRFSAAIAELSGVIGSEAVDGTAFSERASKVTS